jgi:hypothetical protein
MKKDHYTHLQISPLIHHLQILKMKYTVATTLAALTTTAFAHGGVTRYIIEGKSYDGYIHNFTPSNSSH